MAEWTGKIVTCDRCGAECRREFLKDEHYDGGFTVSSKFAPMKDGWEYHRETGWLCPTCEKEFQEIMKSFMHINAVDTTKEGLTRQECADLWLVGAEIKK